MKDEDLPNIWLNGRKPIPQKILTLRFIAEQGVVSIEDINRHFYPDRDNSKAIRVALYEMGVSHLRYYSQEFKNGVWFISKQDLYELLDAYFPYNEFSYMRVKAPLIHLIPHHLELNHIRTAIEKEIPICVIKWYSESHLRSLPASYRSNLCATKIPDAIFWRKRHDGTEQKFFLEYERSLKNTERYVEIFRGYANREDTVNRNVIYICHTPQIRLKLMAIEERQAKIGRLEVAGKHFQFLNLDQFYQWAAEEKAKRTVEPQGEPTAVKG